MITARARQAERLSSHYFRLIDCLVAVGLALVALGTRHPAGLLEASLAALLPMAVAVAVLLAGMRGLNLYAFGRGESALGHVGRIGLLGIGAAALASLLAGSTWPLAWVAGLTVAMAGLHLIWTGQVRRWRREGRLTPNIVIVGATRHAESLIREALKRRDLNVLGLFDDRADRVPESLAGVPVLGGLDDLIGHRMTPFLDRIVVAVDPTAQRRLRQIVERLERLPNAISLIVDQDGQAARDAALSRLAEAPLAPLDGPVDPDRRAFRKRVQDLLIGGLALILLAPVMALVALAVRLDSPGPIFFRQRRHGFNNEDIQVWKFRSMRHEAADPTAQRQVTSDDDRITRVGRFIRKTSLDELPQLLNVLKGEMSLVGPRPHAVGMKTGDTESARLVAEYAHRHRLKPGMTGWAAVKGSRGPLHTAAEVRRRVQLDIDYIDRQSTWLDLWILLITVPVLLGDREAVR